MTETSKVASDSSATKADPKTLCSEAEGEIPRQAFTDERSGLFAKTYLSGDSVYERLDGGEAIQYLLVNGSSGVTIEAKGPSDSETITPDSGLRALAAVTDQRILLAIGSENGDRVVSLDANEITDAKYHSSLLTKKVVFETSTKTYTFDVKKRESSDLIAAAEYVQSNLVPIRSTGPSVSTKDGQHCDSTRSTRADSDAGAEAPAEVTDGSTAGAGRVEQSSGGAESTSTHDADETPTTFAEFGELRDVPESMFIRDSQEVPDATRETLRGVLQQISATDPSTDELEGATETLESARDDLREIADDPGLSTELVEEAIEGLDEKLTALSLIRSAIIEVRRKIVLAENGMQIPESTVGGVYSTINEAIDTADELGRSTERLEEYRNELSEATGIPVSSVDELRASDHVDDEGDENDDRSTEGTTASDPAGSDERTTPSREELIADLHEVGERVGGRPEPFDVRRCAEYSGATFMSEFQTWDAALDAAFPAESTQAAEGERTETTGEEAATEGEATTSDVDAEPTRERVLDEFERLAEELGKRPTTAEFDAHAVYDTSDVYDHFKSWSDAIDAASIETASRQNLLDELRQLESELGFAPMSPHVDEHSQFSTYDYRQEFGSVDNALDAVGIDLQERVMETLRSVVDETDGTPKMADFAAESPYSANVIYKFFESWADAVEAAKAEEASTSPESGSVTTPDEPGGTQPGAQPPTEPRIQRNELSELYELLRNLRVLVTAVVEAHTGADRERSDPMVEWDAALEEYWRGESTEADSYGTQQRERNPFSMQEYRQWFGNGDDVTSFETVRASRLSPSVEGLLAPLLDTDPEKFHLPVDTKTGAQFPIIVESDHELELAKEMLRRLPAEPSAATTDERGGDGGDEAGAGASDSDLTEVNGVTDTLAQSLRSAGYPSRDDLRKASMDELAAVDGCSEQIAMRIKLDVGE